MKKSKETIERMKLGHLKHKLKSYTQVSNDWLAEFGYRWGLDDIYVNDQGKVIKVILVDGNLYIKHIEPSISYCGYAQVGCKSKHGAVNVHTLVARAFLGEQPKGYEVDHINKIRDDNRVSNLRYVTKKENMANADYPEHHDYHGRYNWKQEIFYRPNGRKVKMTKEEYYVYLVVTRGKARANRIFKIHSTKG